MTLFEVYPVLLLLGVLGLAILWEVRHLVVARIRARRLATAGIGLLAVLMVISLSVRLLAPAPGPLIPPSRLLSWKSSHIAGPRFDPATAQTTTVVPIEVEHPACAPFDVGPWLADPIIAYTPWSVTITMHMNDTADTANCSSMEAPHRGLPIVGGYLTGLFIQVHLSEPLGGRALFDGSAFPPAARPYP